MIQVGNHRVRPYHDGRCYTIERLTDSGNWKDATCYPVSVDHAITRLMELAECSHGELETLEELRTRWSELRAEVYAIAEEPLKNPPAPPE